MKVLMMNRKDAFDLSGGDTVQMLKTKEYLEKHGICIDISTDSKISNINDYDLIHIFNIMTPYDSYNQLKNAKKIGKKVVLSTIYQSRELLEKYYRQGLYGHNKLVREMALRSNFFGTLKSIKRFDCNNGIDFKTYFQMQKTLIEDADILLPNSMLEMEYIKKEISKKNTNFIVVPNGVDFDYIEPDIDLNIFELENFVFCPGRIEPLKNQIGIIKALEGLDITIVFAGQKNCKHKVYLRDFEKLVEKNVNIHYLGKLEYEQMIVLYKKAKVTALCSWFETTGLVALEGGCFGNNIVITQNGYTKEYFEDNADYCSPDDINSIRNAILLAFNKENNDSLKNIIKENYTWEIAAKQTLLAYERIQKKF